MIACLKFCIFLTSNELWWLLWLLGLWLWFQCILSWYFVELYWRTWLPGQQISVVRLCAHSVFNLIYFKVEHLTAGTQPSKHVKTPPWYSIAQELLTPWCCIAKANTGFLTLKSHKSPKTWHPKCIPQNLVCFCEPLKTLLSQRGKILQLFLVTLAFSCFISWPISPAFGQRNLLSAPVAHKRT